MSCHMWFTKRRHHFELTTSEMDSNVNSGEIHVIEVVPPIKPVHLGLGKKRLRLDTTTSKFDTNTTRSERHVIDLDS